LAGRDAVFSADLIRRIHLRVPEHIKRERETRE
jgi:hypothetical protein